MSDVRASLLTWLERRGWSVSKRVSLIALEVWPIEIDSTSKVTHSAACTDLATTALTNQSASGLMN